MGKKALPSLNKMVADLRKWVERPDNKVFVLVDARTKIEKFLDPLSPAIRNRLDSVAAWEGNVGALHLFDGKSDLGWNGVHLSYLYKKWSVLISIAYLDRKHFKSVFLWDCGLPLAHAIAIRDDRFADFLGRRLCESLLAGDKRFENWQLTPFEPFMATLYARWRNIALQGAKTKICPLGVFQQILDSWDTGINLKHAVEACCDYHLERTKDTKDEGYPEFMKPLYMYWPIEVLAIKRIRQEQGLPMPEITHPLMETPLAHPPEAMPNVEDELLNRVIAKVRTELPIGDA